MEVGSLHPKDPRCPGLLLLASQCGSVLTVYSLQSKPYKSFIFSEHDGKPHFLISLWLVCTISLSLHSARLAILLHQQYSQPFFQQPSLQVRVWNLVKTHLKPFKKVTTAFSECFVYNLRVLGSLWEAFTTTFSQECQVNDVSLHPFEVLTNSLVHSMWCQAMPESTKCSNDCRLRKYLSWRSVELHFRTSCVCFEPITTGATWKNVPICPAYKM